MFFGFKLCTVMSWWWFAFPPCNQSVLVSHRLSFSLARQMGRSVRRQRYIQFFRKLEGTAAEDGPSFSMLQTHESGKIVAVDGVLDDAGGEKWWMNALRLVFDVEGWDTIVVSPHSREIMSQTVVWGEWGALQDENASFRSVPRTQPHVHAVVCLDAPSFVFLSYRCCPGRTSVFICPHLRTKTDEAEGNSGGKSQTWGRRSARVEGRDDVAEQEIVDQVSVRVETQVYLMNQLCFIESRHLFEKWTRTKYVFQTLKEQQ